MRFGRAILILVLAMLLANCMSYDFSRRVVVQGNLLPASKTERLKVGMNKQDVLALMGTSLLSSPFEEDRWDYVNTFRKGSSALRKHNLTLYFKNDRLIRIEKHP